MRVLNFILLTIPLLVSACNNSNPAPRPVNKPAPAPAADKGGTNSTGATTAQHLHSPAAGAKFISSCTFKLNANLIKTSGSGVPSSEETQAREVANSLGSQGKMRMCSDLHIGGNVDDQGKIMHLEDQSAVCDSNAQDHAGSANKVFSISQTCAAPETGMQGMSLGSGTSNSQVYTTYYRSTLYFDNLTAEEKARVVKYLVPWMQKSAQGSSGGSSIDATPSLK